MAAPTGTVTFLFTDIEGSTWLWEASPEAMSGALERHDAILKAAVDAHGGYVFSRAGDGLAAAFGGAGPAVGAAIDAQRALGGEPWPPGAGLRVRMGLHTGEAVERGGDYFGSSVNRAARLMAAANGGQVVVSDVTASLVSAVSGIGLIDLGSHRLRGLVDTTRVFGVKADGVDWLDRPLATDEGTRGNLPRPVTEWFGPLAEINRQAAELGRRRLVTVTGPGGVGKTRIATEVGALVASDFPDGVWFVELAPVTDPDAVHTAVATTLGVMPRQGLAGLAAVTSWLEGRRLLLIVDNCEHVLSPAAELATAVARQCPTVTMLATSREPLGVTGEQVVPIPSLGAVDAVELFCDRARLADGSLEFSAEDREVVTALCERLDGIPLAIELAAARARSLTPADLLSRLSDRFKVLRGGGRGGVERHRTLQATVSWSYQLLSDAERALFDRLSVFAGGFDLAAAEAVCAGDVVSEEDVLDLLTGLVDKSLVMVDRSAPGTRYRLLETLRQYGEDRLAESASDELLRRRHVRHYVAVASEAYAIWASPRTKEAIALFNREWDNFRAAHSAALELADLDAAEALLANTFQHAMFSVRADHYEWSLRTIEVAEGLGRASPSTFGQAGGMAWFLADHGRGIALAERGIGIAGAPDDAGTMYCWTSLTASQLTLGRFEAVKRSAPALDTLLWRPGLGEVEAFWAAGTLFAATMVVDPAAVGRYLDRVERAASATGADTLRAYASFLEAGAFLEGASGQEPNFSAAVAAYRRAIALGRAVGAPMPVAYSLASLVMALSLADDPGVDQACREAIMTGYETGSWPQVAYALMYTAGRLASTGNVEAGSVLLAYVREHQAGTVEFLVATQSVLKPALDALLAAEDDVTRSRGASMTREEAVEYALSVLPAPVV